jgi:hypothetical protein
VRASATRCHWPPESTTPVVGSFSSPSRVGRERLEADALHQGHRLVDTGDGHLAAHRCEQFLGLRTLAGDHGRGAVERAGIRWTGYARRDWLDYIASRTRI